MEKQRKFGSAGESVTPSRNAAAKADLRRRLKGRDQDRLHLSPGWENPLAQWLGGQVGSWGAYCSLPDELPVETLLPKAPHLTWVFPRVISDEIHFFKQSGEWVQGRFTSEPSPDGPLVRPEDLAGLLIPALAIDRRGFRLGRGGGFYDRFLNSFRGVKIGLVPSWRFLPEVPVDPHDCRVDAVFTEQGLSWL
ncbi:MAG: 5-formyltetrahydrofolate cyclo-ligase [Bdellovibrio sp.]|nr:MAG: 5-formyltetrahydrofolate cyclo-ligase [Bdellovibrio sp.]